MNLARTAAKQKKNEEIATTLEAKLRLTFIVPTYNREKTVGSAMEQLSLQIRKSRYRPYISILVSENHSTDRTAEIVDRYAQQNDFIKVVSPPEHLPSGEHNLFFALKYADSDFVWSFADDDLMLPGTVDWMYERLLTTCADFILINSQYQDANGQVLRDHILDMNRQMIAYDNFAEIFTAVGPLTLLASFSSAIYRPSKMISLDLDSYLEPCAIYAHVFAYLEAFFTSRVEIISAPLVVLRRSTATAHWESVAQRYNWYLYYPWTGSLANHLLRVKNRGAITADQYGFALNSNENGRYGLIANMLVQFILQLLRVLEYDDPRELPPPEDFAKIRAVVQDIPYVAIDTLDFLLWGEKNFADTCGLLALPESELRFVSNKMANAVHDLDLGAGVVPWKDKIRQSLIEKLHGIKSVYINVGTVAPAADSRPFTYMAGRKYVMFQLALHYVVMTRDAYDQDWQIMQPNYLDPHTSAPDWYVFNTFDEALKHYTKLDQQGSQFDGGAERSNQVFSEVLATAPWNALRDVINTGDVQAFVEGVGKSPALKEVRKTLNLILGQTDPDERCNVQSMEPARHGFINPLWYKNTYTPRVNGIERELLQCSPLIHYVLIGSRKGWSLSPFVDEFLVKEVALPDDGNAVFVDSPALADVGLVRYFSGKGNDEISEFFSVPFYVAQCRNKGVKLNTAPPIHFLQEGVKLGLNPHPNWDEAGYLNNNSDVKQSSDAPYLGWLHWCTHGRFEKRKSGFSRKGIK